MDDLSDYPLNVAFYLGGQLCKVVRCGDDLDLLQWVQTDDKKGFWLWLEQS